MILKFFLLLCEDNTHIKKSNADKTDAKQGGDKY